jgi:hypothetical protein
MQRFRCAFVAYVPADRYCPEESVVVTIDGRRMAAVAHGDTALEALERGLIACARLELDAAPVVADALGHVICGKLPPALPGR